MRMMVEMKRMSCGRVMLPATCPAFTRALSSSIRVADILPLYSPCRNKKRLVPKPVR